MVDKISLENIRMLDAKKVRLSLALLPGRVVRLVGVGRVNLHSGIYRYPKENTKNQINHKTQGAMRNHMMTCQIDAKIPSYNIQMQN